MSPAPEFATEALAIDDAREAAFAALRVANARGVTGADLDAISEAMEDHRVRCERLRRWFYPRRHKLVVSPTGRRMETVWQRPRKTRRKH